jgi:hypothetical protein
MENQAEDGSVYRMDGEACRLPPSTCERLPEQRDVGVVTAEKPLIDGFERAPRSGRGGAGHSRSKAAALVRASGHSVIDART